MVNVFGKIRDNFFILFWYKSFKFIESLLANYNNKKLNTVF